MAIALVIFVIAYVMIAVGRIPHVLIAVLGGMAMVFLGVMPGHEALDHVNLEVIFCWQGEVHGHVFRQATGRFDWLR